MPPKMRGGPLVGSPYNDEHRMLSSLLGAPIRHDAGESRSKLRLCPTHLVEDRTLTLCNVCKLSPFLF